MSVPLSSVAEIRFGQGPSSIQRFNRERRVVIGADMALGAELSEGLGTVWALPEVKDMPAGTRIQETGDAEIMGEVFAGFATAMGTGLMLVLVVLILLFGSVFHSFTILGFAAAGDRRRGGRRCGSPIRPSRCRSSSAS